MSEQEQDTPKLGLGAWLLLPLTLVGGVFVAGAASEGKMDGVAEWFRSSFEKVGNFFSGLMDKKDDVKSPDNSATSSADASADAKATTAVTSKYEAVETHSESGDSQLLLKQNDAGKWDLIHADNKELVHPSASHIKLVLASEIADKAAKGEIDLNKTLTLTKDIVADDPHVAPLPEGATMTVKEALHEMLTISSNSAYNVLLKDVYAAHFKAGIEKFGAGTPEAEAYAFEQITKELHLSGFKDTKSQNFLNLREGYQSERWLENANTSNAPNLTSADDISTAMQNLWTDADNPAKQEIIALSRAAMGESPDRQSQDSLGEKASGNARVSAHAGVYQKQDGIYMSIGLSDAVREDDTQTQRYSPFVQQAEAQIEQHRQRQLHDKQSKLESDTKEVRYQLNNSGVSSADDFAQAKTPMNNAVKSSQRNM
jgi:beta-lactamase class A